MKSFEKLCLVHVKATERFWDFRWFALGKKSMLNLIFIYLFILKLAMFGSWADLVGLEGSN